MTILIRLRNALRALLGKPPVDTQGGGGPKPEK
jgi:hypothetical protein